MVFIQRLAHVTKTKSHIIISIERSMLATTAWAGVGQLANNAERDLPEPIEEHPPTDQVRKRINALSPRR